MADFPAFPQAYETRKQESFNTQVDRADSGKPRLRTFYSRPWVVFQVVHELVQQDKETLLTHYHEHRNVEFRFSYQSEGLAYSVRYANVPVATPVAGNLEWKVVTTLVGLSYHRNATPTEGELLLLGQAPTVVIA